MEQPNNINNNTIYSADSPNLNRWLGFNRDNPAPESFLIFGFYSMVAMFLQRRVFLGSELHPLFPNIYVMLVGRPGLGKGLTIKPINSIVKHFKIGTGGAILNSVAVVDNPSIAANQQPLSINEQIAQAVEDLKMLDAGGSTHGSGGDNAYKAKKDAERLLIPLAPDATTYEALCTSLAKSFRAIQYKSYCPKLEKETTKVYGHSSLAFSLEEVGSLFRKKTEDTVNLLLSTYDCGDYTKETRTQGNDYIKKCCLNFLGGTTPDFMQQVFSDALLNQGFSSRTFFIYATTNRFHRFTFAEYSSEQLVARDELLEHFRKLSTLYGQCQFSEEANLYLKNWWENEQSNQLSSWRANLNNKLDAYYARKNIHVSKMAMIMHFADTYIDPVDARKTNMIISLSTVIRAMNLLKTAEASMHYALVMSSVNPLSNLSRKVRKYLEVKEHLGASKVELVSEFWEDLPSGTPMDMQETLTFLIGSGEVTDEVRDSKTFYKLIRFKTK